MSETGILLDKYSKNIFIKVILLGPFGVGKKSIISRINKIKCHKSIPITVKNLKDKCSNVIRYIYSGITISFLFFAPSTSEPYEGEKNELSSSDEDTDICNNYHIKFTQTKKDIKNFLTFLYNANNCYITEYFAFLYDLSNFENSLKELFLYFQSINTKFKIKEHFPIILFGTKIDKKIQPKNSKIKELNSFIESLPNAKHYEIGAKFNYDFNHFFAQFAQSVLSQQSLITPTQVEQIMEKIEEQPSFSKAPKFEKQIENASPGPAKYLNNIYDTSNMKERIEALTGNNRFNTKLFINKKGPQLHQEKIKIKKEDPFNKLRNKYEIEQKEKLQKVAEYLMGEQKGFSFGGGVGTGQGKKLLEERKRMAEKRNELYYGSFENNYFMGKPKNFKSKSKTNVRYDNLRINILDDNKSVKSKESNSKINTQGRYESIVKENKSKILEENEDKIKKIVEKSNRLTEEDRKQIKEKYKDIIFGNNSLLLKKTDERIKEIKKSRERAPSPNMYDVSKGLLDRNKGFSILSRRPQLIQKVNEAPFVYLQSDFDKCVKNQKIGSIGYTKRHDKRIINTENDKKFFDEDKFEKYEKNRFNSERHLNTMEFLNDRKDKQNMHIVLLKQIKEREKVFNDNLKERQQIKEDNQINYKLVESSSPKYSMRGKYVIDENRDNKLLYLNGFRDFNQDIKRYEPNYNYVKPRIQTFVFPREERFKTNKSESNLSPKKSNNSIDYSENNNNSKNIDDLMNISEKPKSKLVSAEISKINASKNNPNNNLEVSNDNKN